jgi:TrmH family RNA methyltransferase
MRLEAEWLRDVLELRARKGIDPRQRLLLEGLRLIGAARRAGLPFERVLYTPEFFAGEPCQQLLQQLQRDGVVSHCVPPKTFSKLSYKAEGLVAIARFVLPAIEEVLRSVRLLVLDGLSDPGNIGAVLRTANAWGPAGVILVGAPDKLFHPKCLRASMGALFHTPATVIDRASLIAHVTGLGRRVVVLAPDGDPVGPPALAGDPIVVFGNERYGVHPSWHDVTTARVAIPMAGIVDSLNVATTAAIVLWETFGAA